MIPEVREEMLCWGMEEGFQELERGCCIQCGEGVLGVREWIIFFSLSMEEGFQEFGRRCYTRCKGWVPGVVEQMLY